MASNGGNKSANGTPVCPPGGDLEGTISGQKGRKGKKDIKRERREEKV